ncbi:MAG: GNAT family N-acetyltransferase [Prevotellaceae bacterium]|nr:GNAT family N-acetyltransferase [Prevotella sp.]MDD7257110.1 GNAT family N-acetyltransferase [Prevotellaceae bacterium]MDY6130479.1 GNAT family N-acetyltransferase [Prevotella sp.]
MTDNPRVPMVRLRAMEPEDLDILYHIENDRALWNVGVSNVPYSRYVLRDYIAHSRNDIYADRQLRLMIEDEERQVAGIVDLVNFEPQHRKAELGILVRSEYRGKGIATAALREMLSYAQNTIHLHQVYAFVDATNELSVNLFLKLNFRKSMFLKDWLYDGSKYHDAFIMQFFL